MIGACRKTPAVLGIACGILGFLTSSAPADEISDAFDCQTQELQREADQQTLLQRADSLGAVAAEAGDRPSGSLLRQAQELQDRAMELEVDLVLERSRCRRLAATARGVCQDRIDALLAKLRAGTIGADETFDLVGLVYARDRLDGMLAAPAVHDYALLPLEPEETTASLRAKLQYYEDVAASLQDLDTRIERRLEGVREEAEVLREAERLVSDIEIDAGDRAAGDRSAALQQQLPGNGGPGPLERPRSEIPWDQAGSDLDFALHQSLTDPRDSGRIIDLLEGFRRDIRRELSVIQQHAGEVRARMESGSSPQP